MFGGRWCAVGNVQGPNGNREEELTRLIRQHEKDLLKVCYVYLQNAEDARDAVQETFLKAFRKFDTYRGRASEKTWLTRIAVNTCRDMRKSAWIRHVNRRVSLDDLPLSSPPPDPDRLALMEEILRLPRREREAVALKYQQNMTAREIAQALGVTPMAVSKRLRKAYEKLKHALEGGENHAP